MTTDQATAHDVMPGTSAAAMIDALPARQRRVLGLRLIDGLSVDDAARALGVSAHTVRLVQHSALETLRRRLREVG